ncbi:MAG: ATP-binding protein [Oscillospiraceae bacterium]|nr:ATP-binding protein [Oscillospiraceae bacterium]
MLYSEVEFLIRQELREPALYNTVLEAIAHGNTQLNDIFTKTQIDKSKISVYLKNLIELQILEREFSAPSSGKEQSVSTRGLYRITDNFFRFWFSFMCASLSDLETGDAGGVFANEVQPQLNAFASPVFETICREFLRRKNHRNELPFRISKLGRWWGKLNKIVLSEDGTSKLTTVDAEIDIVAVDKTSKNYILCECKFRNSEMDISDLERLKEKSSIAGKGATIRYALFSKSGFTRNLITQAKDSESIMLFSLEDIAGTDNR